MCLTIWASRDLPPSSALQIFRFISITKKKKIIIWTEFNDSKLQLGNTSEVCISCSSYNQRSWATCRKYGSHCDLSLITVASHHTTPELHAVNCPGAWPDRVSSGSGALRPRHRDPSLTKYSQAPTWRSRSKANIIVDLVMLLLKITKALIKLGKTDRPGERRRKYAALEPRAEEQTNSSLQRRKTWQHVVNSEVWTRYVQWLSEHRTMKPEEKHLNRQCFVCL